MKNKRFKKILKVALGVFLTLILLPTIWYAAWNSLDDTLCVLNHSFISKKTSQMTRENDADIYIDRRVSKDTVGIMKETPKWLSDCKLYQDFAHCPNAYLILTTKDVIMKTKGAQARAYHLALDNKNYIFFCDYPYMLHELGHFADSIQGSLSLKEDWRIVFEKEFKMNLKPNSSRYNYFNGYYNPELSESEQLEKYLKETFAEAFACWYSAYYPSLTTSSKSDSEDSYIPKHDPIVTADTHPLAFAYMRNFYEHYTYNVGYRGTNSEVEATIK